MRLRHPTTDAPRQESLTGGTRGPSWERPRDNFLIEAFVGLAASPRRIARCATPTGAHNRYRPMSHQLNLQTDPGQPAVYQIRVKGHLGGQWTDWFGNMSITLEDNGDTLLTGLVTDQAALHGLLRKVRDLGVPLLSVLCIVPDHPTGPDVEPRP